MSLNGGHHVNLKPVNNPKTLPPQAPPTKEEADRALNLAIDEMGCQELNLLKQLELVKSQRECLMRLRDYLGTVSAYHLEVTR